METPVVSTAMNFGLIIVDEEEYHKKSFFDKIKGVFSRK